MRLRNQLAMTIVAATVFLAFIATPATAAYIVESNSGGSNFDMYSDYWCYNSSAKSTAAGCTPGIASRYSTNAAGSATYSFIAARGGTYEMFVTWGRSPYGDTDVTHTVDYGTGQAVFHLNQDYAAGLSNMWNSLGTCVLDAGQLCRVIQTNPSHEGPAGTASRLMADAVKWEVVPEPATLALLGLETLLMQRRRRRSA